MLFGIGSSWVDLSYAAAIRHLRQFEHRHPEALADPNTVGLRVELRDEKLEVVISVREAGAIELHRGPARTVISRPAQFLAGPPSLSSNGEAAMFAGSWLKSENTRSPGTAGWNFRDAGGARYCLTNWHVVCGGRNDVALGLPVRGLLSNGKFERVASLADFSPVHVKEHRNTWDLAILKYDDRTEVGRFKRVQKSAAPVYPTAFATTAELGSVSYKVGAGSQFTRGRLSAVGHHRVTNLNREGDEFWFFDQLFFKPLKHKFMTRPGDSGSVLVDERSNLINGLNFARVDLDSDTQEVWTIANPLHRLGWKSEGGSSQLPAIVWSMPTNR
jgi:hypothetical protein